MQFSAQFLELPKMRMLHQRFSVLPSVKLLTEMERERADLKDRIELPRKGSVAIEKKDLRLEFDGSGNLLSPFATI